MSTQVITEDEHKLLMLKREEKARAGRKGGAAACVARAENRAAWAELKQALEANAKTPQAKALVRSTLAAYSLILRMQNPAGPKQQDIRGVSALLSNFANALERFGGLPESTTSHRERFESASNQPALPEPYCLCQPGDLEQCEKCKARLAARP